MLRELALFAGAGGGILGGRLLGWRTVCAVEINPYRRDVLMARQNDRSLGPFPVWDDVRTFDGSRWRGCVDVVSGGFPCQDVSSASKYGKGLAGKKSGLWFEMARIIDEVRPEYVLVENATSLRIRGLVTVLKNLDEFGFNSRWTRVKASDVGAPHGRPRLWLVAHAHRNRKYRLQEHEEVETVQKLSGPNWWKNFTPSVGTNDGVAHRMDRLKALGEGQVPAVAALAWETLKL